MDLTELYSALNTNCFQHLFQLQYNSHTGKTARPARQTLRGWANPTVYFALAIVFFSEIDHCTSHVRLCFFYINQKMHQIIHTYRKIHKKLIKIFYYEQIHQSCINYEIFKIKYRA